MGKDIKRDERQKKQKKQEDDRCRNEWQNVKRAKKNSARLEGSRWMRKVMESSLVVNEIPGSCRCVLSQCAPNCRTDVEMRDVVCRKYT